MPYEKELKLLCETLKRCRVPSHVTSPLAPISDVMDFTVLDMVRQDFSKKPAVLGYVGVLAPHTMYKYTDEIGLCYIYLALPATDENALLFIGPYAPKVLSSRELLELAERVGVPPRAQRDFEKFYINIPVLPEGSAVFLLLDAFCEQVFETPAFAIDNVNAPEGAAALPLREAAASEGFDETLLHIKTMEERYRFEGELMRAVALGQIHKEKQLQGAFSEKVFERRTADPLRNAKNYCIISNTLLRKAAEQGGVHPVYIDKTSGEFALRIEQMTAPAQSVQLMREMFRAYCRLVRKHSIQNYSLTVQKTILLIESDLSADLSLSALAAEQSISAAYLSTLFKRETGKTVSEYIREKRIHYAASLLATTHLQVQTVALHCGIVDVQYFSKLFKKQMGKTPKEYREAARLTH